MGSALFDTAEGLVVMTGGADPAKRLALAMGVFHLFHSPGSAADLVVGKFREMKAEQVFPAHCSGGHARRRFKGAHGANDLDGGAGAPVSLDPAE